MKTGEMKFTWEWCTLCRAYYVKCPRCGNNSCNGGYGRISKSNKLVPIGSKSGKVCDVCPLAYQYQGVCWKHKDHPKPTKKMLRAKPDRD